MTIEEQEVEKRPLITYALTAYNTEEYIRESVEAAFSQTYSPLEIILSDDCSSDRTFEIMKEMATSYQGPHKIILNRNEENLRVVRHCNKVYLDLANGEFIVIAHGDDLSKPERTEKAWEYMKDHFECSGLSHSICPVDDEGNIIKELQGATLVNSKKTYSLSNISMERGIANIPSPSRTIRRSVMETFGFIGADCPMEDDVIGLRILLCGEAVFLPDVMVNYRRHEGNLSNRRYFSAVPLIKIYKQLLRDAYAARRYGMISTERFRLLKEVLNINMRRRFLTRTHYEKKDIKTLAAILYSRLFNIRFKLNRIRFHFAMLRKPEL